MKFRSFWVLVVLTLCVVGASANPSGDKRKPGNRGKSKIDKTEMDNCKPKPPQKTCHSEAVHKCGKVFKKGMQILENTPVKVGSEKIIYRKRCDLRETFLNCVETKRKKKCKSHGRSKPKYQQELKDVAKKLWSTRGCLLGIDY